MIHLISHAPRSLPASKNPSGGFLPSQLRDRQGGRQEMSNSFVVELG